MKAVGIDLGTSNSVASYWENGEIHLVPNEHGNYLVPSFVGMDDQGELVVGEIAKERYITHPKLTAGAFKRFMGTNKKYELGNKSYHSIELSAILLKNIKQNIENHLSEPCEEVIISVPAYFNNVQREATLSAAQLAGFKVKQLISEPTAAAIAYGLNKQEDQTILVLDLGGGTFDVSLLDLFEGIMQVEAISGDNYLGGEDFTNILILDFLQKNQLLDNQLTSADQALLYQKMEQLKRTLSDEPKIIQCSLSMGDFEYAMGMDEYTHLCQKLLQKMRAPISRVLSDAKMSLTEIDHVILVGGATRCPVVRQYVAKLLKKIPYTKLEPDYVIAYGAGIQAHQRLTNNEQKELILTDVCAHSMGVDVVKMIGEGRFEDGYYSVIIERNTTIPVSREEDYYTVSDNQREIVFGIYQGENLKVENNLKIGELSLAIPPNMPKNYPVTCRFTYDVSGILEVMIQDKKTGTMKRAVFEETPGTLSPAEIEEALEKLSHLKVHPKERAENQLLLARLNRLYMETVGEQRQYIERLIIGVQQLLDSQEEELIKREIRRYIQEVNQIESELWM